MANVKTGLKKADLQEGRPVGIDANGKKIMVVMVGGAPYAIDAVCSHRDGPLEKGAMKEYNVACPWHGAAYDVRNGNVSSATPWGKHQASYKVSVDQNGDVWVDA